MEESKDFIVETCINVINGLSQQHKVSQLNIRIDLENMKAKPVFGLFDKSSLIARCSLKDLIRAGGGQGFTMILNVYLKNILKDIFSETMKRLELSDPKQMFVLLYLGESEGVEIPMISLYKQGQCMDSMPISEVINVTG